VIEKLKDFIRQDWTGQIALNCLMKIAVSLIRLRLQWGRLTRGFGRPNCGNISNQRHELSTSAGAV
jgi:hypothetical protein